MAIIVPYRFKGNVEAVTIWPFIFVKPELKEDAVTINHERIHLKQQAELLLIGFYAWYFIEWLIKGYDRNAFESEAYENENNLEYLKQRKWYAFRKYRLQ